MISGVQGIVHFQYPQEIGLSVHGLILEISVPCGFDFPIGSNLFLHIAFVWREQQGPALYGFQNAKDKELFLELCQIKSLGAKTALNILAAPRSLLVQAVLHSQPSALCEISGIGPKTAARIVNELKKEVLSSYAGEPSIHQQSRTVLKSLGFDQASIDRVLPQCSTASIEECIRSALALLGERKHVTTTFDAN